MIESQLVEHQLFESIGQQKFDQNNSSLAVNWVEELRSCCVFSLDLNFNSNFFCKSVSHVICCLYICRFVSTTDGEGSCRLNP
jgi:hypothetical protein